MNVLSLFDGISCGRVALDRAGIRVNNYYASEVDQGAISVAIDNHNGNINLGCVTKWRDWGIDFSTIDLVIGGSPCQGFSFAGNQLAFDDPRSALFFTFVDIVNHIKSLNKDVMFLLENVRMRKEFTDVISDQLGVSPVRINSSLVSAQMRDRNYWANWNITLPPNKNIKLTDIIQGGYVEKEKSWCALESWSRFPVSTDSARKRYSRSMMPIVFLSPCCSFENGWRELTVNEVERLQTLPDGYCRAVSDKKAKGLLGNGWTVDVITHIFNCMLKERSK